MIMTRVIQEKTCLEASFHIIVSQGDSIE